MNLLDPVSMVLKQKGHHVLSVAPHASVYEAIELMAQKAVGALLVVSEEKLVGIISERDYARKVILRGKASRITEVQEIMTAEVVSVTPEDNVQQCMLHHDRATSSAFANIRQGKDCGGDFYGGFGEVDFSAQRETIQHLERYIANGYPAQ